MSPILVRPVREQLEHDRIVRLLQAKARRRFEAAANPGMEQNTSVRVGSGVIFPDVVLFSQDRGHRLQAVIEVETGESVNHLEALSQWAQLANLRVEFHLYVPASMVDVARRLCEDNNIQVNETWSYHLVGDQFRFTLMHRARTVAPPAPRPAARPKPAPRSVRRQPAARPAAARPAARKTVARAKTSRTAKPVRKARAQKRR